uniref:Uncharacterized protein n=1 Tax=Siphoviridae sp. ctEgn5 TaxID=2825398 RepID=A0A8S5PGC2_9CAUD|nr:MAG TPA: hypothetical protein [Siphoviridae sp. ctEgn5]
MKKLRLFCRGTFKGHFFDLLFYVSRDTKKRPKLLQRSFQSMYCVRSLRE